MSIFPNKPDCMACEFGVVGGGGGGRGGGEGVEGGKGAGQEVFKSARTILCHSFSLHIALAQRYLTPISSSEESLSNILIIESTLTHRNAVFPGSCLFTHTL